MAKKVLFIDRDGTIIKETIDEQINGFDIRQILLGRSKIIFSLSLFEISISISSSGSKGIINLLKDIIFASDVVSNIAMYIVNDKAMRKLIINGIAPPAAIIDFGKNSPSHRPKHAKIPIRKSAIVFKNEYIKIIFNSLISKIR